ncbi:putative phosphoglycerate mutase family protein [Schizopora paradoxa]|uniref:Putative phosphoglycerate mutase family protein n=1 Tax=Schizopora paradoxa TaxID=27342 RepID=A0A0H2RTS9_9AGAM|nr:putative phosphoglycerate mutase family protein [Schizopora paradoxa]
MGWFDSGSDESNCYDTYQNCAPEEHQAKLSHEVIGGAAAYEAMKAYENHCAQNGQPASHAEAKEVLAGLAGAFVDREFETKGLNFIDKEKAKYDANKRLEQASAQDY